MSGQETLDSGATLTPIEPISDKNAPLARTVGDLRQLERQFDRVPQLDVLKKGKAKQKIPQEQTRA